MIILPFLDAEIHTPEYSENHVYILKIHIPHVVHIHFHFALLLCVQSLHPAIGRVYSLEPGDPKISGYVQSALIKAHLVNMKTYQQDCQALPYLALESTLAAILSPYRIKHCFPNDEDYVPSKQKKRSVLLEE